MDIYMAGVLQAESRGEEAPMDEDQMQAHPGIASRYDGLGAQIRPDLRFGCAGLTDLRRWFPSPAGCRAMTTFGAVISTYEVPDACVLIGRYRVLFSHQAARLINTKSALITNMATPALEWAPTGGVHVARV